MVNEVQIFAASLSPVGPVDNLKTMEGLLGGAFRSVSDLGLWLRS